MRRSLRMLLLALVVVITGSGLLLALRVYLASNRVTQRVARQLETIYGGQVAVGSVNIGLVEGSSLRGLRLYENRSPPTVWAEVDHVQTDLSIWELLRGETTPRILTLTGAAATLQFDKQGHLVTRLPARHGPSHVLPSIHIHDGQVTLQQEGRSDMVIRAIDTVIHSDGDRVLLKGDVNDPYWGHWSVHGALESQTDSLALKLKSQQVHVTHQKLTQLPFVSPAVWKAVQARGDTPVEFSVHMGKEPSNTHFRLVAQPPAVEVNIPGIDLCIKQAGGQVVVEDYVVHLNHVHGQALGGTIKANADLNFEQQPPRLHFQVHVGKLDLHRLPLAWRLPESLRGMGGKLGGQANLTLRITKNGIQTQGTGDGVITDARLAELPVDPIRLQLHADGRRFHFTSQKSLQSVQPEHRTPAPWTAHAVAAAAKNDAVPGNDPFFVTRFAQWTNQGLRQTTKVVHAVSDGLSRYLQPKPKQARSEPNYLDINLSMRHVDVAQLLKGLRLHVPVDLTGKLTFRVQASVPVDSPRDLKAYRLRGTALLQQATLGGVPLDSAWAQVTYRDGALHIEELRGLLLKPHQPRVGPPVAGNFFGTAQLQVVPAGDLTAQLSLRHIPVSRLLARMPSDIASHTQGDISGNINLRSTEGRWSDLTTWQASGTLTADRIDIYGVALTDTIASIRTENGVLKLQKARANLPGAMVTGDADLHLVAPYRYQAKARTSEVDLLRLLSPGLGRKLPVTLAGKMGATADLRGSLSPWTFTASGVGTATDLQVDKLHLGSVGFRWRAEPGTVKLTDIHADLYGGTIAGTAQAPLNQREAGKIELSIKNLDAGAMSKDVVAIPFRLEGRLGGTIQGTLTPSDTAGARNFTAKMDLSAPQMRVQGIETERLHGTVHYDKSQLEYHLQGDTLGGSFDLDGKLPLTKHRAAPPAPASPGAAKPPPDGRLTIQRIQLSRLWASLRRRKLGPMHGQLSLHLDFWHQGANNRPTGTGTFDVLNLRWDDTDLAGRLRGEILLSEQELYFRNLAGSLGEGLLRGYLHWHFHDANNNRFALTLNRVSVARLLAFRPELASHVQGIVDIRMFGVLARTWHGLAEINFVRGKVFGAAVSDWRFPIRFHFVPAAGIWYLQVAETSAQVEEGRATGRASLALGAAARVQGQVRFNEVNMLQLLRRSSKASYVGAGRLSGRVDFAGDNVQSLNDISAQVETSFHQPHAAQFPVVQELIPFLASLRSPTTFQKGRLRGRLDHGLFRVQSLTLTGPMTKLYAHGTITLDQRLNLNVIASTSRFGINPAVLTAFGLQLPAGPLPLGLLLRATTYLSNRVIYLSVTGTLPHPSIRIDIPRLLEEEIVRFFLNQSNVPIP